MKLKQAPWQVAPDNLQLADHELHVWKICLNDYDQKAFVSTLSEDEIVRANRFKVDAHRLRFMIVRGLLRRLLSKYLETSASDIQFDYSEMNKPSVKGIEFNLSHSGDYAVIAICRKAAIGIDLEQLSNRHFDYQAIAKRFFSETEQQYLIQLPKDKQQLQFYLLWTSKEAILKAMGKGIGKELKNVVVEIHQGRASNNDWSLVSYLLNKDHLFTLAIKAKHVIQFFIPHDHLC